MYRYGYFPCPYTLGLYKHKILDTTFTLEVDDFVMKYTSKADALHLINCLRSLCTVTADWSGFLYIGITLDWNYSERYVDLSMPGYIGKVLLRFTDNDPHRAQHTPHAWFAPTYGVKVKMTPLPYDSLTLSPTGKTRIQEVIGTILYHARNLNSPILPVFNTIGPEQATLTEDTADTVIQLLKYCATYPNPVLRFVKSDMIYDVIVTLHISQCRKIGLELRDVSISLPSLYHSSPTPNLLLNQNLQPRPN